MEGEIWIADYDGGLLWRIMMVDNVLDGDLMLNLLICSCFACSLLRWLEVYIQRVL